MENEIAEGIIRKVSPITTGPAYEDAVRAGALYWQKVLEGKDAAGAKRAADEALSRLMGCEARISGHRATLRERILGRLHR